MPLEINQLYQSGLINEIDRAFAQMIDRRLGGIDPMVSLAAVLVSRATASGDVCLDLAALAQEGFQPSESPTAVPVEISLGHWIERLSNSPAVGALNENKPMILDGCHLYLQRYWRYENLVAQGILARCDPVMESSDMAVLSDLSSDNLFFEGDPDQLRAINVALTKRFAVISGGPGTGKTYTIAQIILYLQRLSAGRNLKIKLAAPTGKAAARLQEALDKAFETLQKAGREIPADVISAQTIHRLLGAIPGKTRFLFNNKRQLPADVVIVDEASMIDLALMAKLVQAVPAPARLILVGDKDQLASVEAGAVLGDICGGLQGDYIREKVPGNNGKPNFVRAGHRSDFKAHIVVLKKNYRFDANSGIDELSAAVNAGDIDRTLDFLQNKSKHDIVLKPFSMHNDIEAALERLVMEKIAPIFNMRDAQKALKQMNTLKILTPLRKGPVGVQALNQGVEQILVRHDVIEPHKGTSLGWYAGRPVMITCNDYYRNLFNGDVGIAMNITSRRAQALQVFFPDSQQGCKSLVPEQLPAHETVYAMTVHKSQGTEFDLVVLVLPDIDVPLLTRELLYTAVTRARQRVEIWGRSDILKKAISRRIRRASGLKQALWATP